MQFQPAGWMLENTGIFSASVGQDPANRCAYRDTNVYKKKKKMLSAQSLNPSDFHRFKLSGDYGLRPRFARLTFTHSLALQEGKGDHSSSTDSPARSTVIH